MILKIFRPPECTWKSEEWHHPKMLCWKAEFCFQAERTCEAGFAGKYWWMEFLHSQVVSGEFPNSWSNGKCPVSSILNNVQCTRWTKLVPKKASQEFLEESFSARICFIDEFSSYRQRASKSAPMCILWTAASRMRNLQKIAWRRFYQIVWKPGFLFW